MQKNDVHIYFILEMFSKNNVLNDKTWISTQGQFDPSKNRYFVKKLSHTVLTFNHNKPDRLWQLNFLQCAR